MRYVGIDVSAKTLSVVIREGDNMSACETFDNISEGHVSLIKHLKSNAKNKPIRVCLEATGVYHFDCAVVLSKTKNIELMVINPKASKNFAAASMQRSKTDAVDAEMLSLFCKSMPFLPWSCPSDTFLQLRSYARKLASLSDMKTRLKNQKHAMTVAEPYTAKDVLKLQNTQIKTAEKQMASLKKAAVKFACSKPEVEKRYRLLISIKGIGELSAIQILGELMVMPKDMTPREWVAHSGLNPVAFQSGTSVNKKTRISKAGNRYLRRALYMPALTAANSDPYVRGYYWHLITDRNLKKSQAICAVMRKLLHAIHGMFENMEPFDNTRFYKKPLAESPEKKPAKCTKSDAVELTSIANFAYQDMSRYKGCEAVVSKIAHSFDNKKGLI